MRQSDLEPAIEPALEPRSTAALLVNAAGEYLLHLRDANKPICDPGTWSLPGGAPEGTETLEQAIARELREETGLSVDGLTRFTVARGTIQVFLGRWDGDAAELPVGEGILFRFFAAETMARLTMCPWAAEVIARHLAETRAHHGPTPSASAPPLSRPRSRTVPNVIGAHLYLEDAQGRILLGLRHPDSAYAPSAHHFLAGHCEQESAIACVVREAHEEAGLVIDPADVSFAHAVHLVDAPGTQPRLGMVFRARRWTGTPEVLEPDRCVSWAWWPVSALPEPIVPYTRAAVDGIRAGRLYTELGWT